MNNAEEFVRGVVDYVYGPACADPAEQLLDDWAMPDSMVDLRDWFRDLPAGDRAKAERVARLAADAAVFGFLCALDGARNIGQSGDFVLRDAECVFTEGKACHEIYRGMIDIDGSSVEEGP